MTRFLLVMLMSMSLLACTTMQTMQGDDRVLPALKRLKPGDEVVVVVYPDNAMALRVQSFDGQVLQGRMDDKPVSIPVGRIKAVRQRQLSVWKTLGLGAVIGYGVICATVVLGFFLIGRAAK